jgi:Na+/glutamate symporter
MTLVTAPDIGGAIAIVVATVLLLAGWLAGGCVADWHATDPIVATHKPLMNARTQTSHC